MQTQQALLIPFAVAADKTLVGADEVPRGRACGCTCLECGQPLIAKQGKVIQPHFAHEAHSRYCASTGESVVHRVAKIALLQSPGKTIRLALSGFLPQLQSVQEEVKVARVNRIVDIMAVVEFRVAQPGVKSKDLETNCTRQVAIEIKVTNAKDAEYARQMEEIRLPVYEKEITPAAVYAVAQPAFIRLGLRDEAIIAV